MEENLCCNSSTQNNESHIFTIQFEWNFQSIGFLLHFNFYPLKLYVLFCNSPLYNHLCPTRILFSEKGENVGPTKLQAYYNSSVIAYYQVPKLLKYMYVHICQSKKSRVEFWDWVHILYEIGKSTDISRVVSYRAQEACSIRKLRKD